MAALWARLRSSLPVKMCERILRNVTFPGKNSTAVAKEAASSIPKGMDFPGVRDQSHLRWLLSQHYILFKIVAVFSDLCAQLPAQTTHIWAQVEQLCRKISTKGCTTFFTYCLVLKNNDDFSSESSPIILSLCLLLFSRDLQSLEKEKNGANRTQLWFWRVVIWVNCFSGNYC